jgi:hypothetical protein
VLVWDITRKPADQAGRPRAQPLIGKSLGGSAAKGRAGIARPDQPDQR